MKIHYFLIIIFELSTCVYRHPSFKASTDFVLYGARFFYLKKEEEEEEGEATFSCES